jgi:Xaa-Pro aminopeptidase
MVISQQELERRYDALRAAMRAADYETLVIVGNTENNERGYVRYVSDWRMYGGTAYVVFQLEEAPVFILGLGAQAEWAKQLSAIPDTRAVLDKTDELIDVLKKRNLAQARIGVVGMDAILPHGDAHRLMHALPDAHLTDTTSLMQDVMVILSDEELALAEQTHGFVVDVMERIKATLAPGKTEREVMAEAIQVAAGHGCLDGMAHLSRQEGSGTRPALARVIEPEDTIKVFLEFAGPSGFLIELGSQFSFSTPSDEKLRKFETVSRAIQRGAALMRPGATVSEVCEAIRQVYVDDGWTITGRRLWDFHGQGLNSLMPPIGMPDSQEEFKENMMINVHPGILTERGGGVTITNNYIVTPEGGRPLGDYEHEWPILSG